MPLTKDQVVKHVDDLKKSWKQRNDNFERAYKRREMYDRHQKAGQLSIALNDGRAFLDQAIFMLSHKQPTIHVPVLDKPEPEQRSAGGTEVFLHGIQRQIDHDRFRMGLQPWRRDMSDFLVSTGWWADHNLVLKNSDGAPNFIAEVLDPAQVFPEFGYNTMNQIAHVYPSTLAEVQTKADLFNWEGDFTGDGQQQVLVEILYWLEAGAVWNALIVSMPKRRSGTREQRELAIPPMERPEFDQIPIRTGPANGWAVRNSRTADKNAQAHYGEGILASGEPMYDAKDTWATIITRKAQESIEPTTKLRSNSGKWVVSEDDLRSGVAVPVSRDQDIEYAEKPGLRPEISNVLMPMLDAGVQRAGGNDLLLGNINPNNLAGAGYALSLVEPRMLSKLLAYKDTLEHIGASRDSMFLEAYRDGDFAPIVLSSRNDEARDIRKLYFQEWEPKDLPESSMVDWEIALSMPDTLMQQIAIARQALPEGDLLDIDTALERVMKVDDIDRVKRGIRNARVRRDPAVAAVDAIMDLEAYAESLRVDADAFRQQGDEEAAASRMRSVGRIEQIITQRIQQIEGAERGPTAENGLPPEAFGTQMPRIMNEGQLTPGQGVPAVGG